MACAGLLLVVSVAASTASNLGEAARENSSVPIAALPDQASRPVSRVIDLSVAGALHNTALVSSSMAKGIPVESESRTDSGETPGFSLGPVRTEFGGISGRHMNLATMKLQGVSIFGGSIGASVGSRSAKINLSWPTSP